MIPLSKTTLTGILTVVGALVAYALAWVGGHGSDPGVLAALFTAISTGIGLIKAADAPPAP